MKTPEDAIADIVTSTILEGLGSKQVTRSEIAAWSNVAAYRLAVRIRAALRQPADMLDSYMENGNFIDAEGAQDMLDGDTFLRKLSDDGCE